MIYIQDLKKSYSGNDSATPILSIRQLSVKKGERVVITGQSGSGKSTLLHIAGGVMTGDEGMVVVNGNDLMMLSQLERDRYRAETIGYIFQDFHLIPSLTAEENIRLAIPISQKNSSGMIGEWFGKVGLQGKERSYPHQLSRGQQQRVAMIRAFIHQPAIILADEPTGSLDVDTAKRVTELMLKLCEENQHTLLCVTHDRSVLPLFTRHYEMASLNERPLKEEKGA